MLKLSRQLGLGTRAPSFRLPGVDGNTWELGDFDGSPGLLVAFICNHCPFVLHVLDDFVRFAHDYQSKGIQTVAISSNDVAEFPEDDFEHMRLLASERGFSFPYLHDQAQEAAIEYGAICTPDFFLYGADRTLFYAGQYDSSRPHINRPPVPGLPPLRTDLPVTGEDLRNAADRLLAGDPPPQPQKPSAGCSIKWLPGKDPSWA